MANAETILAFLSIAILWLVAGYAIYLIFRREDPNKRGSSNLWYSFRLGLVLCVGIGMIELLSSFIRRSFSDLLDGFGIALFAGLLIFVASYIGNSLFAARLKTGKKR